MDYFMTQCFTQPQFVHRLQQPLHLKQAAVKTKLNLGGTNLNHDVFYAGGLCEAALKVRRANTKEPPSHVQLYYGRRERAVT